MNEAAAPQPDPDELFSQEFYRSSTQDEDIAQGDILFTELLDKQLYEAERAENSNAPQLSKNVYPYFFDKYKLCIVLNASCDLVSGSGRSPKVSCVQLVALSPLTDTLEPLIKKHAKDGLNYNLISESAFSKLSDDFRKIIDGQHKTKFFLPQLPKGIPGIDGQLEYPWVAKLDVIVSLRFNHPKAFASAKTGMKLEDHRASKLAENTAALFNRIALDDVGDVLGSEKFADWIGKQLYKYCIPIKQNVYRAVLKDLRKEAKDLSGGDRDNKIIEVVERYKDQTQSNEETKLIELIKRKFSSCKDLDAKIAQLQKDQEFKQLMAKFDKITVDSD